VSRCVSILPKVVHRSARSRNNATRWALTALIAITCTATLTPAHAADETKPRHYEIWTGVDVARTVWLAYGGTTLAPFSDIHEDGLRLRYAGGYGQYKYLSNAAAPPFQPLEFRAAMTYQEGLIGYLKRFGPLTAKAFIGYAQIDHRVFPLDRFNRAQGSKAGVKGVIELWLNIGSQSWASLDLSWAQAHNTRSARTRVGYKVYPNVSMGMEAGLNMDSQAEFKINEENIDHRASTLDYGRVGGFVRLDWYGGEVSVSGGLLGNFTRDKSAYATVNYIKQF